jgi:hypothetical protein
MRYFVFLAIFGLVFGAIVVGTKSIDSSAKLCGVSSSSCGVSADTSQASGFPHWLPGPAEPVSEYTYQQKQRQYYHNGCNNSVRYCHSGHDRWAWQPLQPVRNVVRFFHNRKPLRKLLFPRFRRCC